MTRLPHGLTWHRDAAWRGAAQRGAAWHCVAWCGVARRGAAERGGAGQQNKRIKRNGEVSSFLFETFAANSVARQSNTMAVQNFPRN